MIKYTWNAHLFSTPVDEIGDIIPSQECCWLGRADESDSRSGQMDLRGSAPLHKIIRHACHVICVGTQQRTCLQHLQNIIHANLDAVYLSQPFCQVFFHGIDIFLTRFKRFDALIGCILNSRHGLDCIKSI